MTEPIYETSTERLYRRLPEFYRTLDAQNSWNLKTYISSIGSILNDLDTLLARIEYVPIDQRKEYEDSLTEDNTYERPPIVDEIFTPLPIGQTSDLLDGRSADPGWLPYIAQLIGTNLVGLSTVADKRDAVVRNYLGFRAGSRQALEEAAKSALVGDQFVRIYQHRDGADDSISSIGTEWDILIITKPDETVGNVIEEITRKRAKPAGTVLHHITYILTWNDAEQTFDTWSGIEDLGNTWGNIETGNADLLEQ